MNKFDLVKWLYELITEENIGLYRDLFNTTDDRKVTDPYWKEALSFYRGLSDENKVIFFKILTQVEIDTVSNILALLDGVTSLVDQDDDFVLTFKKTNEIINGDLQDLFLEYVQNNSDF